MITIEQRRNRRRCLKFTAGSRANIELKKQINTYLQESTFEIKESKIDELDYANFWNDSQTANTDKEEKELELLKSDSNDISFKEKKGLENLVDSISKCSSINIFEIGPDNTFISAHTCKNRFCRICANNNKGMKQVSYISFFKKNEFLFKIIKKQKNKKQTFILTENEYSKRSKKNVISEEKVKYNLMFLTLTVPHTKEHGFNGNKYYFKEIKDLFMKMKSKSFFKKKVYGGVFSFETTINKYLFTVKKGKEEKTLDEFTYRKLRRKGELVGYKTIKTVLDEKKSNGLHIHLHALLMVEKKLGNRDLLHKDIAKEWNQLTENKYSTSEMNEFRIKSIMKGNKTIDVDFCKKLNPKAATLIGLENIYTKKMINGKMIKVYAETLPWGSEGMINAVLETVKYQFEPQAFNKDYKRYEIDLLAKVIGNTTNVKMTGKWGAMREAGLDINSDDAQAIIEEFKLANEGKTEETEKRIVYSYNTVNMVEVYQFPEEENKIKISRDVLARSKQLPVNSSSEATAFISGKIRKQKNEK